MVVAHIQRPGKLVQGDAVGDQFSQGDRPFRYHGVPTPEILQGAGALQIVAILDVLAVQMEGVHPVVVVLQLDFYVQAGHSAVFPEQFHRHVEGVQILGAVQSDAHYSNVDLTHVPAYRLDDLVGGHLAVVVNMLRAHLQGHIQTIGVKVHRADLGAVSRSGYVITSACENPEAAFKLGDFMYTPDSSIRLRQGEYEVDWKMAEEGQKTFDGKDAEYARITPLVTDGDPQNQHMGNTGLFRESNDSFIGLWAVKDDFDIRSMDGIEQLLIEQTWPYEGYEPDETLPPVVFTEEEASELNTIETEVKKYCDEQRTLFITGQRDLDADWDDYVSNLKDLGIDRLVEGYNTAYARQYLE